MFIVSYFVSLPLHYWCVTHRIVLQCLYRYPLGLIKPSVKAVDSPLVLLLVFRFHCLNTETSLAYLNVYFDVVIYNILLFLGAFVKLRKATIIFPMYIYLSVCRPVCVSNRRMEQLGCLWTDSNEIWCQYFSKICWEYSSFIKIFQEQRKITGRLMQIFYHNSLSSP